MRYTIYLFHFSKPVGKAQHYIGSCETIQYQRRMREHHNGYGSKTTRKVSLTGSTLKLARLWASDTRDLEQILKRRGHFKRLCPLCNENLQIEIPAQYGRQIVPPLDKSNYKAFE